MLMCAALVDHFSLLKLLLFEDLTMHLLSPVNRQRFSSVSFLQIAAVNIS